MGAQEACAEAEVESEVEAAVAMKAAAAMKVATRAAERWVAVVTRVEQRVWATAAAATGFVAERAALARAVEAVERERASAHSR